MTTTAPTGLPQTAPPSAGDVPVQGASSVTQHNSPEQTKAILDGIPEGQGGTVHLSDGSSMKVIKKGDGLYDVNTGKRIQY
jgi:hypothetical protein